MKYTFTQKYAVLCQFKGIPYLIFVNVYKCCKCTSTKLRELKETHRKSYIILGIQPISVTKGGVTHQQANNGSRMKKKQQGKVGLSMDLIRLVRFLSNQLQTDMWRTNVCLMRSYSILCLFILEIQPMYCGRNQNIIKRFSLHNMWEWCRSPMYVP